jgi:hypothetical protein
VTGRREVQVFAPGMELSPVISLNCTMFCLGDDFCVGNENRQSA